MTSYQRALASALFICIHVALSGGTAWIVLDQVDAVLFREDLLASRRASDEGLAVLKGYAKRVAVKAIESDRVAFETAIGPDCSLEADAKTSSFSLLCQGERFALKLPQ